MKGIPQRLVEAAYRTSTRYTTASRSAVVPRIVREYARRDDKILDFGSGKAAPYTAQLRGLGYDCTAYEFEDFADLAIHDRDALTRLYDIVFCSGVLNVQGSPAMLRRTLGQVFDATHQNSVVFADYPHNPRKLATKAHPHGVPAARIEREILKVFGTTPDIVHGTTSAPVWMIRRGAR